MLNALLCEEPRRTQRQFPHVLESVLFLAAIPLDPHRDARGFRAPELLQDTDESAYFEVDRNRPLSFEEIKSDLVLSNVIYNQVLFVDAMRWLVGEESWSGEVNNEEDIRIEHTKQQDLAWFYATIFGVPGLVLGGGLLIRRRALKGGGK